MSDVGSRHTVAGRVLRALDELTGLRPAPPVPAPRWARGGLDPRVLAITLASDPATLMVRLVACELPLPPLLDRATDNVRRAMAGTEWAQATIRLVITALDPGAFADR